jgi:hypothetical protein
MAEKWRFLVVDELASRRIMRERAEQAVKDTQRHGQYTVEYVSSNEYYKRTGRLLPGTERVLMFWDPANPNLMYCLDVRQIDPSRILSASEHGIVWITLSPSGEIIRMPSI